MMKKAEPSKPDIFGKVIFTVLGIFIIVFIAGVIGGVMKINKERSTVKGGCTKTEFVVLGGRSGDIRYVYDCTGVDLK